MSKSKVGYPMIPKVVGPASHGIQKSIRKGDFDCR